MSDQPGNQPGWGGEGASSGSPPPEYPQSPPPPGYGPPPSGGQSEGGAWAASSGGPPPEPAYGSPSYGQPGQPGQPEAGQGQGGPGQAQPGYGPPPYGQPPAYGQPGQSQQGGQYGQPGQYGQAPYPSGPAQYGQSSAPAKRKGSALETIAEDPGPIISAALEIALVALLIAGFIAALAERRFVDKAVRSRIIDLVSPSTYTTAVVLIVAILVTVVVKARDGDGPRASLRKLTQRVAAVLAAIFCIEAILALIVRLTLLGDNVARNLAEIVVQLALIVLFAATAAWAASLSTRPRSSA